MDLNDPYLTTTNKFHRRFTHKELDSYPRKDIATYWECEEFPKAWGFGAKHKYVIICHAVIIWIQWAESLSSSPASSSFFPPFFRVVEDEVTSQIKLFQTVLSFDAFVAVVVFFPFHSSIWSWVHKQKMLDVLLTLGIIWATDNKIHLFVQIFSFEQWIDFTLCLLSVFMTIISWECIYEDKKFTSKLSNFEVFLQNQLDCCANYSSCIFCIQLQHNKIAIIHL